MANSSPQNQVYCTRPSCQHPTNIISEESLISGAIKQRFCSCCGMPLILERRFLPLQLLIPDEERGGFGRTFLAQDLSFPHRPLRVIKQLHPRIPVGRSQIKPSEMEVIERLFQREANTLAQFNNPQIPRAWAFAVLEAPADAQEQSRETSRQKFFYLAQDYIEGQNLAQELQQNGQFSGREVVNILQQLLPVLQYIHQEGAIHRDIKPSNIMRSSSDNSSNRKLYLIDFGAVKQVVAGVPTEQSCILGTPFYAPPEQLRGAHVSPASDLYSLAATCVCLLTDKNAQDLRRRDDVWVWRQYTRVNDHLAGILDRMLLREPEDRYQSAEEVLAALSSRPISPPPVDGSQGELTKPPIDRDKTRSPSSLMIWWQRLILRRWLVLIVLALIALVLVFALHPPDQIPFASQIPVISCIDDDRFSCGEKRLIVLDEQLQQKIESKYAGTENIFTKGIQAFKESKYDDAIKNFEDYLQNFSNDPEARIYLNNARAANSKNFLKIAACVPIYSSKINRDVRDSNAEQLLRGIAVVQEEINSQKSLVRPIQNKMLFIEICNDRDNEGEAEAVANKIVQQKDILGVIGHYSSNTTLASGKVYGFNKVVAISPTSTAIRDKEFNLSPYVFRVAPDNSIFAEKLISYVPVNLSNIAIFYVENSTYSQSLRQEFKKQIALDNRRKIVDECKISKSGTEMSSCVKNAENKKAQVILALITHDLAREKALTLLKARVNLILGGSSIYTGSTRYADEKVVIAISWLRSNDHNLSHFEKESNQLWKTRNINYLTGMAYDATQAMVQGLRNITGEMTRDQLYVELKKKDFSADGANVEVEFKDSGDRIVNESNKNKLMFLVTPKDGDFVPVK